MKKETTKKEGLTAARKWVTIRVTLDEKNRLLQQAGIAGLSLSEYMRRRFFGGRPLVAQADAMMASELRRVGGLFKSNFETLRQGKVDPEWGKKQEYALRSLSVVLEKISASYRHDRQES